MTYIKKVVMHGFKSFSSKTEVPFDKGINVIVGPNGAGKSNISDALCFALGRLSAKSMRASKAKNFLFMGSKSAKPAKEASVEITFDNSNKTFNIPTQDVKLKRIVKRNGTGVYKINDQTKTRSEIIETLAHAGIDPYGFNIVLQGNIQSFVKLPSEERRKIIEEVAGISIYEMRKEKSLKELEKTDLRLKDIGIILRQRTAYLRNLERERSEALRYKSLETSVRRCRASILDKKIDEKNKELTSLRSSIEQKIALKEKEKSSAEKLQDQISQAQEKITQINKLVQKTSGVQQETLKDSIINLRAELEGLKVRKENYEHRRLETENRIEQIRGSLPDYESEIESLKKGSPGMAKKQESLRSKKSELSDLEKERKNLYKLKTELHALRDRLKDKEAQATRASSESDSLLKQIEEFSQGLKHADHNSCEKEIKNLKSLITTHRENQEALSKEELEKTKAISAAESRISEAERIVESMKDLDTCPLCQNKMTEKHVKHVQQDSSSKISEAQEIIKKSQEELSKISDSKIKISNNILKSDITLSSHEKELVAHHSAKEKQEYIKRLVEQEKLVREEISELESRRENLEKKTLDLTRLEDLYSTKILEIEEISSRTEKDAETSLLYKERELEKSKDVIRHGLHDLDEMDNDISEISETIENKESSLSEKESDELKLNAKFKKMFQDRDSLQEGIQKNSLSLSEINSEITQVDEQINYLKIGNAKVSATKEALEMEFSDFHGVDLIKASISILEERLEKSKEALMRIGSINMRALEVYDDVKADYERVQEKVDTLEKEKIDVLKIIEEIDRKKKRTFMKTFKGINELFTENYAKLSSKGDASLVLENPGNIFDGGVDIEIKMGKGKRFDVTSLSGGEQTLVALSLLFSIQEHKPYHFYIFDEIDAALDKRNSERLSGLLRQYMKNGQYIVVTHNDAIISDSSFLYGVSMHEGVSKVLSLKLD